MSMRSTKCRAGSNFGTIEKCSRKTGWLVRRSASETAVQVLGACSAIRPCQWVKSHFDRSVMSYSDPANNVRCVGSQRAQRGRGPLSEGTRQCAVSFIMHILTYRLADTSKCTSRGFRDNDLESVRSSGNIYKLPCCWS